MTTTRTSRYTPQEDRTILECIAKNPANILAACEVAANLLDRSARAVSMRYYSYLKNPNTPAVAAGSAYMVTPSVKNAKRARVVPEATTIRNAMLYAAFTRLSKEKAVEFFIKNLNDNQKAQLLTRITNKINQGN